MTVLDEQPGQAVLLARPVEPGEADAARASRRDPAAIPLVSIVVANHNGGTFIEDALASAMRQTVRNIEIIVVDDASSDDSVSRVRLLAKCDSRIRLVQTPQRSGPGGARNHGLSVAHGTWIAILDSDDLMHPQRLARLVEAAEAGGAEIIADNQIVFDHARVTPARPLLARLPRGGVVSVEDYVDSNRFFSGATPLGYLKPLFLRSFMEAAGCCYDPSLVIAEDYDLVLRLLLAGARFRVEPQMTYFYRRHGRSISHRLSTATLLPMLEADRALRAHLPATPFRQSRSVVEALDRRRNTILRALDFECLVEALKRRDWGQALRVGCTRPRATALLRIPVQDRLRRLRKAMPARSAQPDGTVPEPAKRRVTLLSRQRIVGITNGSSAYLLSLCDSLKRAGYEVDLVSPSPAMFGRWPFFRLSPAMDVFGSIRIRGAVRFGPVVIASDPRVAVRAAAGIAARLLGRAGITMETWNRKAPHAIAVPLADADRLFVANAVRPSQAILADYAFLNEAIPFALQPRTPSAVVMHDLFSSQDPKRAVVLLDRQREMALLDQADAVIAIQAEEGDTVSRLLPHKRIILAPMAVSPVPVPQPGQDGTVLFVGSNTGPNIDGIEWFLCEVWPTLLERRPGIELQIAGTCCGSLSAVPRNVVLLGQVDDLEAAYGRAGIVVSPLRLGSGLKIKLVEAIGRGKAVIATETTLQGVGDQVADAVVQADTPMEFLAAFDRLLDDDAARLRLGAQALHAARRHFSPDACYSGLLDFIGRTRSKQAVRDEPADAAHFAKVLPE